MEGSPPVHALSIVAKTPSQWEKTQGDQGYLQSRLTLTLTLTVGKVDKSPACKGGSGL